MKPTNENEKNPDWQVPVRIPGVNPHDYPSEERAAGDPVSNADKKQPDAGVV